MESVSLSYVCLSEVYFGEYVLQIFDIYEDIFDQVKVNSEFMSLSLNLVTGGKKSDIFLKSFLV